MQKFKKILLFVLTASLALSSCGSPFLFEPPKAEDLKDLKASQLSESNNQFSIDLFKRLYDEKNIFVSPLSVSVLLNMMLNGANGKSLTALKSVLHASNIEFDLLNKANQTLLKSLQTADPSITLRIGNSLWLNQKKFEQRNLTWKADQVSIIEQEFLAQVSQIDMEKGEAHKINDWASKATEGKISKLIEPDKVKDSLMFLLNAIYFKADWNKQFKKENTHKNPFYITEISEVNADLMNLTEIFNYAEIEWGEKKSAQIIELPYGKSKRLGLYIVLPEKHELKLFLNELRLKDMMEWKSQMTSEEVSLTMPKFKLEQKHDLKEPLRNLGLESFFDLCDADLSNWFEQTKTPTPSAKCMEQEKVDALAYIDKASQSTYVQVNEEGTEAAAVTVFEVCSGDCPTSVSSPPKPMIINRPFFYMVYDNLTESIVFMGAIHDPNSN